MRITDLYPYRIQTSATELRFPADVSVTLTLGPNEFFGCAPLSGKLAVVPVGATLEAGMSLYRGPQRFAVRGTHVKPLWTARLLNRGLTLEGNKATVTFNATSEEEFVNGVLAYNVLVPAVMSGAYSAPLEVESVIGTIQGEQFQLVVDNNYVHESTGVFCIDGLHLQRYFETAAPQEHLPCMPLTAALRYLQQADRLESEGRYVTTFLAERLLNLAKALEAMYPPTGERDDVNRMRTDLAADGVAGEYVEVFASIRYLRNQVDVGHVAFEALGPDSTQTLYKFAGLATGCVRALVRSFLRNPDAQARMVARRSPSGEGGLRARRVVDTLRNHSQLLAPTGENLADVKRVGDAQ